MIHHKIVELQVQDHQLAHQQLYRQMFPAPQPRLLQVAILKLTQLTTQVSKRLDRVTLLFLITLLVIAGLRDQVGVTQDTDKY